MHHRKMELEKIEASLDYTCPLCHETISPLNGPEPIGIGYSARNAMEHL
jgi:hypothetical protein